MKTKNLVLAFMVMLTGSALFAQKAEVDTEKTSIEWLGKKIGGQHEGFIQVKSGYLELQDGHISGGKFLIDMTSITCTDLKDGDYNQKLVGHLKSDDFFGVETYPTSSFVVIKSSEFVNGTATVTGELTIKGNKEKINFKVKRSGNTYSATLVIDRSKFDVRYGSNSFFDNLGDKAIEDNFTLKINLVVS